MDPDLFSLPPGKAVLGQKVADFTVTVFNPQRGGFEEHTLHEYFSKGRWVVLFFYPADFTFVCPTELADLAEQHQRLQSLGVEVISVSTDSIYAHMAWHRTERLLKKVAFLMAGDGTGRLSRYFGVYNEATGTAHRGTFVISPEGALASMEVNRDNVGRNAEELVRKLEANVYLAQNPGEVCPARWRPGKRTLVLSDSLVGNVYRSLRS